MPSSVSLTKFGVFAAVGYICAGSIVAILAGLPLFAVYLESNLYIVAGVFVACFLVASAAGILLIRYLVPRYGAKNIYEQDILIYMIGMLFMALTINQAMFLIGIFITFGALAVFFYENFTRQVSIARQGFPTAIALFGWGLGPIVSVIVTALFLDYGLIVARIIFAHFIVIGFWVWIQRLSMHEEYSDAPTLFLAAPADKSARMKKKQKKEEVAAAAAAAPVPAEVIEGTAEAAEVADDAKAQDAAEEAPAATESEDTAAPAADAGADETAAAETAETPAEKTADKEHKE